MRRSTRRSLRNRFRKLPGSRHSWAGCNSCQLQAASPPAGGARIDRSRCRTPSCVMNSSSPGTLLGETNTPMVKGILVLWIRLSKTTRTSKECPPGLMVRNRWPFGKTITQAARFESYCAGTSTDTLRIVREKTRLNQRSWTRLPCGTPTCGLESGPSWYSSIAITSHGTRRLKASRGSSRSVLLTRRSRNRKGDEVRL